MNETRQLARFAAATKFDDLPAAVVEHFKVYVLDNLACGFAGSVQPWCNMVADMIREGGGNPECTAIGKPWRANVSGAALVNGVFIGGFETDHGSAPASGHPSGTVFPAAMAIAERHHSDGRSFLTAMALGYEAVCRIGESATRAVEDVRGFHGPATNGQFGAALAAGKLLGFDEGKLTNALGIAGSHSAGLLEFVWEGAMTKRLHLGRGAQMGLESAILASKGFTGPSTVLEGKFGFFNVFSPAPEPHRLLADLGRVWLSKDLQIKPYACHGTHQSIVQGLHQFQQQHRLDPKDIRRVVVAGSEFMIYKHDDHEPKSVMGAQYSMVFGAAIALARNIADPYVYDEKTLWDAEVRALAKRIEGVIDPRFAAYHENDPHAEITIELANGTTHVIDIVGFRGLPSTPFTWEDACGKLRDYASPLVGKDRAAAIIDMVRGLEDVPDMASLAKLMPA